jgi:ribosomal protein S18 acetylase RimI-like enzyme
MPSTPRLTCRSVASAEDLETMRLMRNACRSFMTRYRDEITADEQLRWWKELDHESVECFLFTHHGTAVGFGVIRSEEATWISGGCSWLTGGLLPEYRGRGLGTGLFQILIGLCPRRPCLEVLCQNEPARRVYEHLGFGVIKQTADVITMALAQ